MVTPSITASYNKLPHKVLSPEAYKFMVNGSCVIVNGSDSESSYST